MVPPRVVFQSEVLARVRVELGLTQEEAATAVGVDVRTYRRYESGEVNEPHGFDRRRASREKILRNIVRELGIDESELIVEPGAATPRPVQQASAAGHALPRAAHFVGRRVLVDRLAEWIGDRAPKMRFVAVIGMGGAGKTSLVERVLAGQPEASFAWSFYEDPRVDAFFDGALAYLGSTEPARPGDRLDRLVASLAMTPHVTLVLDGLEAVQASGETGRARGELEDSRLRLLLRAIVRSGRGGRALVTTRSPLVDLEAWEGSGLETIRLEPLARQDAVDLLRRWGLKGNAAELAPLVDMSGGHALSTAMMGSYLAAFKDGDPSRYPEIDLRDASRDDPLARRLEKLLTRYAAELSPLDRDVLARASIFPRGVDLDALVRIARAKGTMGGALADAPPAAIRTSIVRLVRSGLALRYPGSGNVSAHPFIRRHFRALAEAHASAIHEIERAHVAAELETHATGHPTAEASLDAYESLFEHTLFSGRVEEALAILSRTLGGFSHLGLALGELSRGLRMVRAFASPPHGTGGDDASALAPSLAAHARWRLAYEWGLFAAALGDLAGAVRSYEASLAIAEELGDEHAIVTGLRTLAYTRGLRGEQEFARGLVERSIAIARDASIREGLVRSLALRGALLTREGKLDEAGNAFAEARTLGGVPIARRLIWEAEWRHACGDFEGARAQMEENVRTCTRLGWKGHMAHSHVVLGTLALAAPDTREAREHLAVARTWCAGSGEVEMILRALILEARIAHAERDRDAACALASRARELIEVWGFAAFSEDLAPFSTDHLGGAHAARKG